MTDATNSSQPANSDKVKDAAGEMRALKALLHYKLQTAQQDVTMPDLTGKSGWYAIVNPAGNGFSLQQSPAGAGSAGDLASQLMSSSDYTKGAGQVAYNASLSYNAGSLGHAMKELTAVTDAFTASNMLYNGECWDVAPTFEYKSSTTVGARASIGFGWAQKCSLTSGSNIDPGIQVAITSYNTVRIANENSYNPSTHPLSLALICANGETRISNKNGPFATNINFDMSSTVSGTFLVELIFAVVGNPERIRYYAPVTITDNSGAWVNYTVNVPELNITSPFVATTSTVRVGVKFIFLWPSGGSSAINTWLTSAQSIPAVTTSLATDSIFTIQLRKVQAVRTTNATACPFVSRSKSSIEYDARRKYFSIWRSSKTGTYSGTSLQISMLPESIEAGQAQTIYTATGDVYKALSNMRVYGSNGTSNVTLSSYTNGGLGGNPSIQVATITSGALGATSGVWTDIDNEGIVIYAATHSDSNVYACNAIYDY